MTLHPSILHLHQNLICSHERAYMAFLFSLLCSKQPGIIFFPVSCYSIRSFPIHLFIPFSPRLKQDRTSKHAQRTSSRANHTRAHRRRSSRVRRAGARAAGRSGLVRSGGDLDAVLGGGDDACAAGARSRGHGGGDDGGAGRGGGAPGPGRPGCAGAPWAGGPACEGIVSMRCGLMEELRSCLPLHVLGGQALVPHQLVHGPLVQEPELWLAHGPQPFCGPPWPKGPYPTPAAQPGRPVLFAAPPAHGAPVVCVTHDGHVPDVKPALDAHEDQAAESVTVGVGCAEVQDAQSLVMEAGGP